MFGENNHGAAEPVVVGKLEEFNCRVKRVNGAYPCLDRTGLLAIVKSILRADNDDNPAWSGYPESLTESGNGYRRVRCRVGIWGLPATLVEDEGADSGMEALRDIEIEKERIFIHQGDPFGQSGRFEIRVNRRK